MDGQCDLLALGWKILGSGTMWQGRVWKPDK